jgi:NitT/TauT family transport system substrate-binding protein
VLALAIGGCGDDDGAAGGGGQDGGRTTLRIGVLPIADVAPLYLGIEKGFFEEEDLNVEPRVIQGGAAVVTGVVSGDLQLGFAATEPLILAKARGLPVKIVATGNQAAADPDKAWTGLMVRDGSRIRGPTDLEGQTIGVNAVRGTAQLTILAVLERERVDVSTLDFVEVPFPDMPAALDEGRVPVVAAVEPFVTAIEQRGGRNVVPYFSGLEPGMTIGTYFTLERTIDQDREPVAAFQRAMNRSLEYARGHEQEARDVIRTYTKIPPGLLADINLPLWRSDLNRPSIEFMADLALKHGFIDEPVDVSDMIAEDVAG